MVHCFAQAPANDPVLTGPVFVAAGEDGLRAFSRDGRTWTHKRTGKEGETYTSARFGAGRCVVAGHYGGHNIFAATSDGVTWQTGKHDAQYAHFVRNVSYFQDRFLGLGGQYNKTNRPLLLTSTDGAKWETDAAAPTLTKAKHPNETALLRRFAQGNGLLVGVGDFGRCAVTRDARAWHNAPNTKPVNTLIDVAFGNGVFVGGGMHGLCLRSVDGVTWTDRAVGEEGEHINAMIFDGKQFVGIGQGGTYFALDGLKWQRTPNHNAPTTATFGNGVYVGTVWPGKMLRSTDAVHWEATTTLPTNVEAIAFGVLGKR